MRFRIEDEDDVEDRRPEHEAGSRRLSAASMRMAAVPGGPKMFSTTSDPVRRNEREAGGEMGGRHDRDQRRRDGVAGENRGAGRCP